MCSTEPKRFTSIDHSMRNQLHVTTQDDIVILLGYRNGIAIVNDILADN